MRRDGWTAERQARFIGYLAQTGSVAEATRLVGRSRETAFRLRNRADAASFAHAWDAVLAVRAGKPVPARKVTLGELAGLALEGPITVRMLRGRYYCFTRRPCSYALLRLLRMGKSVQRRRRFRRAGRAR